MRLSICVALVALLSVACSSSSTDGQPQREGTSRSGPGASDSKTASPCRITLEGAQTGQFECAAEAFFSIADNTSSVLVVGGPSNGQDGYASFGITVPGELRTGSISYATAAKGSMQWQTQIGAPDTKSWLASKDPEDHARDRGDFALDVASIEVTVAGGNEGRIYLAHGTMKGTLPFVVGGGASGTVAVTVVF